jgi:membrane protein YdbS with pleckstrin-like domain
LIFLEGALLPLFVFNKIDFYFECLQILITLALIITIKKRNMSFIEKNLANNEKIVYKGTLHWWIYMKNILIIILGVIICSNAKSNFANGVGGVIVFIALIGLVGAYMRSKSSEFVVTNRRVMLKTGVLKRKLVELQLNRAEGLSVNQGIVGRMFNFGSIIVTSGGVKEVFSPIAQPYEFKKQVNNAIEESFTPINNPSVI